MPFRVLFVWRLIFPIIVVIILKTIFMSEKSSKNLLKTSKDFAWIPDIKFVFKLITNDKGKS